MIFLKKRLNTDLVRVFSLTSISTIVKLITTFITIKLVSKIIGPSGIALLGQLNNFIAIALTLSTAGISNGITKYVSENRHTESELEGFIVSGFKMILLASIFTGTSVIITSNYLSKNILHTEDYDYVFILLGLLISFYALNQFLLAVINGFQKYNKFVIINILNSLFGLIVTVVLVFLYELKGALISLITYQSVMFFITVFLLRKESWLLTIKWKSKKINKGIVKKYFKYTTMTFTTAITVQLAQLFIRGHVISEISIVQAGYWEGMNKLSLILITLITSSLSVYYLPQLSKAKNSLDIRKEFFKIYKLIIPVLIIGLSIIYFLRFFIIEIVYSKEFFPMSDLFLWQFCGDFFKIVSWVIAFNMVAKSMTKMFIFTEIIASFTFVCLSLFLVEINGIKGICQAYLINYIFYLMMMIFLFKDLLWLKNKKGVND